MIEFPDPPKKDDLDSARASAVERRVRRVRENLVTKIDNRPKTEYRVDVPVLGDAYDTEELMPDVLHEVQYLTVGKWTIKTEGVTLIFRSDNGQD